MSNTVPTPVKWSFLRDAYDAAVSSGITLYAQLRTWESTARESLSTGQVVSSTSSGNAVSNRSVSFFPPNIGVSPEILLTFLGELVNLHDNVLTALGLTNTTGNRDAIKNEMMGRLVPCREIPLSSFAGLRCA